MFDQPFAPVARWFSATAITTVICATAAQAQPAREADYALPAQELARSIREVSLRSGISVIAPSELVSGKQAPPLNGRFEPGRALELLLEGSGLRARLVGEALVVSRAAGRAEDDDFSALEAEESETIVVTGTNVRGVRPTSPVITITRKDIDQSGASSVEQLMRQVPQNLQAGVSQENFGVPGSGADPTEHGAGVNLRGLGQRATLVLVNGRRLAPSGAGSFVDVSMIPLTAVDRVEILTDGASAIYGSDAVGGVVNFILRERFEGVETVVQAGSATRGDGDQLLAGVTAGEAWSSGRAMLSYEYRREDEILAGDRDYTINLPPDRSIFPSERRHSLFGAASQQIGDGLELELTGSHARRHTKRTYFFVASPIPVEGKADARSTGLTAELDYRIGGSWTAELSGAYYRSVTEQTQTQTGGQGLVNLLDTRNSILEFGLKIDGTLFELPAGGARVAFGGQVRREKYRDLFETSVNAPAERRDERTVRSLFTELHLPLFSEANRMPGLERLVLTAAARLEDYDTLGATLDPKLGFLWSPLQGLTFRGSWGTSFRAPLLSETTGFYNAFLFPASLVFVDPAEAPDGVSLALVGSNPDIQPETSKSWTLGGELKPAFAPGLSLTANYYSIRFSDRIALPTPQIVVVGEPAFEPIVTRFPSLQLATDIVSGAAQVLDFSGPGFTNGGATPADVVVIVDARFNNTAITRTQGLDLGLRYAFELGAHQFTLDANANHIFSFKDQLTVASQAVETLNTPYHPIDWRLRAGLSWSRGGWAGSLFGNHTGSYRDNRTNVTRPVDSFTTIDAGISYSFDGKAGPGWLRGTRIALSALNLLDADPPHLLPDPGSTTGVGYDPVNASARGRFVSLQLRRSW